MITHVFQKTSKNIVTGCVEDGKEKWCGICPSRSNCSIKQKWTGKYTKEKNNGK